MKTKILLLLAIMLMFTSLTVIAQNATDKKLSAENIPFGKKLPPSDIKIFPGSLRGNVGLRNPGMQRIQDFNANDIKKNPAVFKQQILQMRSGYAPQRNKIAANNFTNENEDNSHFHLTKDINSFTESSPHNYIDNSYHQSYAVLNDVIYFAADDGVHGIELWRSDGTETGTYMVKDIEWGATSSNPYNITAANGKLYFSATTQNYGWEPWVSDGTQSGTHLLLDINAGPAWSYATEFISKSNEVYFATSGGFYLNELWKTDGTTAGTKMIADLGAGFEISQLTTANNLLFFTFLNYTSFYWELWRSDGTQTGTYHVATNAHFQYVPAQLTKYNNELYFSADDGTGNKLWVSDGTDTGTMKAANDHGVLVDADYFGIKFSVLNNILYMPGSLPGKSNTLYKYDASNNDGLVKVKPVSPITHTAVIIPSEMTVVHNSLYFKVSDNGSDSHDELWSSDGSSAHTQLVTKFVNGETISNLYDGTGTLYFKKYDKTFGAELWKLVNPFFGSFSILESDVFKGAANSNPYDFTAFKDRLFFSATDDKKGNELFMTNSIGIGATIVKDINKTTTAGSNPSYLTSFNNKLFFSAYDDQHGNELWKSDGTNGGTFLYADLEGFTGSNPLNITAQKNNLYFFTSADTLKLWKTNGTGDAPILIKSFNSNNISIDYFFGVHAANNQLYFFLDNYNTYTLELWRSDGTPQGTYLLKSDFSGSTEGNPVAVVGNNIFIANETSNSAELWKSDGTIAGTVLIKSFQPNLFYEVDYLYAYNGNVFFNADDVNGYGLWKSDGTATGTVFVKNLFRPGIYGHAISNGKLFFDADDNVNGRQLWKTDGTTKGTKLVKLIGTYGSYPQNFTDVNGTLFFTADNTDYITDTTIGRELYKSDGTKAGTVLVKDITPGYNSTNFPFGDNVLVNGNGELYFTIYDSAYTNLSLWQSDGTGAGTHAVEDNGIADVISVTNVTASGGQLFFTGNSYQYGSELYAGEITNDEKFVASKVADESAVKTSLSFNAILYPNPVVSNAILQIAGNAKNVSVTITDMNGKKLWQSSNINAMLIKLPIEKYASGTYLVTITNGTESKTIKLVKQ